jgi:putative tryptophan/tyrosine transport system substrate-binding protein
VRRREFITGIGGAAVAWPLAAHAQPNGRVRRIGVLIASSEIDQEAQARLQTFLRSLADLGWVEGHEVRIDVRWAGPDVAQQHVYARELVALTPDLLLTNATTATQALREATQAIPIVFVTLFDPIRSGVVSNLARPDANVTGFTQYEPPMAGKWLSLLKEVAPRLARVVVFFNPKTLPFGPAYVRVVQEAGERLGVKVSAATVEDAAGIEATVSAMANFDDGGVVALPDNFAADNIATLIRLEEKYRVPVIFFRRDFTARGGLMAYATDQRTQYRDAATYVDRILRGTKLADLPVQFATKFELSINLKTATSLGLTIPEALLATADEVIQ